MLSLYNVKKDYVTGDTVVNALKGVTLDFRDNEFVSVLGASGCGKTTLLNIIGGLDRYTEGDLVINGVSTKLYADADWDAYRNHTIGFVFQSYNLIMHQTVLSNVELALTLSGINKQERRQKALAALEKVGLKDQVNKKPNQLSGGQMQRVAIARAIVNDPDIILADEPTGALDTQTSEQIMDILKEIAANKLVIMVTHNPELAERYSTRIVRLSDGEIVADSNPVLPDEKEAILQAEKAALRAESSADGKSAGKKAKKKKKDKHTSMSFFTALSLSLNNLLTKKARTILVSLAGSIGIIGIALILSLSNGFQVYINKVQEDTLSNYPLTIEAETVDMTAMATAMMGLSKGEDHGKNDGNIYVNNLLYKMMSAVVQQEVTNDLEDFKEKFFADEEIQKSVSAVQFTYDMDLQIWYEGTEELNATGKNIKVNPSSLIKSLFGQYRGMSTGVMGISTNTWSEMIDNTTLLSSQYVFLGNGSRWPQAANEVVLVVNSEYEINDYILYALGILDQAEFFEMMQKVSDGEEVQVKERSYTYDQLLGLKYKLVLDSECYNYDNITATPKNDEEIAEAVKNGYELKVVGIVRPKDGVAATSIAGTIGYTSGLVDYVLTRTAEQPVVKAQLKYPDVDVFTGKQFSDPTTKNTYEGNLAKLGYADKNSPTSINIYAADFAGKDNIVAWIENYNKEMRAAGKEESVISYTDYVGLMMSSISTIINAISYVLIGFVSISLIVSSIMIGIITYISVLERTKEIGILRSIGASKRDISRVFNAETFIVGVAAGVLGVLLAMLIDIPINIILTVLAKIGSIAFVPWWGAVALILISVGLTLIAGLIPSGMAAKKDPVVALRSE